MSDTPGSALKLHPSIPPSSSSLHLSTLLAFQPKTVPTVVVAHNEKGCLVYMCMCMHIYKLAYTCTGMCVTCAVMNKDVLCVELVVNHWQCWQLTDKQIDPRPQRERCLALAHSSHIHPKHTHTHADAWTIHTDFGKASLCV